MVKEWRTVKVASRVEVMRKLEQVFLAPVGKVLQIWEEKERNGEVEGLLAEVGKYAFKLVKFLSLGAH